jgi:hypothetical protein
MNQLKERLVAVSLQLAKAKLVKREQKRHLKALEADKADTAEAKLALKTTKDGIAATKAERKALIEQLAALEEDADEKV